MEKEVSFVDFCKCPFLEMRHVYERSTEKRRLRGNHRIDMYIVLGAGYTYSITCRSPSTCVFLKKQAALCTAIDGVAWMSILLNLDLHECLI